METVDPWGWQWLAEQGLNLTAVLDTTTLPETMQQTLQQHKIKPTRYKRLVLMGNGGGTFWDTLQKQGRETHHLFDDFSIRLAEQWAERFLKTPFIRLYPHTDILIPLQQLGDLAQWCHPSPLGSSVSPRFGPWFAYRVALVTTADLPLKKEHSQPSPCDTCSAKPCMSACPVQAVQGIGRFQIKPCLTQRLTDGSTCEDRCLSRLACPVAPEHRYSMAQIRHHYTFGRAFLKRYL